MVTIKVEKLSKIFGKRTERARKLLAEGKSKEDIVSETGATVGVNQASLEIEQGEIFVIMGLSGSGKSTLVRMLNRLIDPTSGHVYIDGKDITTFNKEELRDFRRNKISMVFQNFGLFPHKTILENTEYGLEVKGVPKKERQERAEKALDNSGLLTYKDQYPDQLSGGMQQRVGLARALANDPEILLMDEAFSALDPLIRRDMQDELVELQEKVNKTIVFITHDLNEALRIGDRIALMKDGEIVQIGTGEEILTNPANRYVERFVEDVDRTKVLTAEHIMSRPEFYLNSAHSGLRVALQRMRDESLSSLLVIDGDRKLQGYLVDSDVLNYIKSKGKQGNLVLTDVLKTDVPKVKLETPIQEIFELMKESVTPVAVVDDDNHLKGTIIRKQIIDMLAQDEGDDSND